MQSKMQIDKSRSRLWYIKRFNLLAGMSEEELMRIAAMTKMTKYAHGSFVYLSGDPVSSIYFLKEGSIKITGMTEDGHEVLLDIIGPGEVFGEVAALQEESHTNSAQALEDSLLCEMARKDFEDLLNMYPKISLHILKRTGLRLKKIESRLIDLICKDVCTRVKETLLDLIDTRAISGFQYSGKINLTQQDIANLVGASRQETARALKYLQDRDIIELKYRSIIVKSPDRLRAVTS